jgi:hypothetical protein
VARVVLAVSRPSINDYRGRWHARQVESSSEIGFLMDSYYLHR